MFSEGMFPKTEDCEGVSSYIQVHMVTMVLNRCRCWTSTPTKAIIGLLKKQH